MNRQKGSAQRSLGSRKEIRTSVKTIHRLHPSLLQRPRRSHRLPDGAQKYLGRRYSCCSGRYLWGVCHSTLVDTAGQRLFWTSQNRIKVWNVGFCLSMQTPKFMVLAPLCMRKHCCWTHTLWLAREFSGCVLRGILYDFDRSFTGRYVLWFIAVGP